MNAQRKHVLHVGCGIQKPAPLPAVFDKNMWEEIRLDSNPDARPDYIAAITDMRIVDDASMDGLFSSHNLEHLYPHEAPLALKEFRRVLKDDGFAIVTLPDIQAAAEVIAAGGATKTLYESPMGPVTALDVVYGHRKSLAQGRPVMLHKCGFTREILAGALTRAGFAAVDVRRDPKTYSLWAKAYVTAPRGAAKQTDGPFGQ